MVTSARLGAVPTAAERADEAIALAREALQRVAELEARVAALQAAATGPQKRDEDGAPGPPGRWMRVRDAAVATKFSQSALRKMIRERRVVFDIVGCHPWIDIDSIPDRHAKVQKCPS
jgi:hypothetical protein